MPAKAEGKGFFLPFLGRVQAVKGERDGDSIRFCCLRSREGRCSGTSLNRAEVDRREMPPLDRDIRRLYLRSHSFERETASFQRSRRD